MYKDFKDFVNTNKECNIFEDRIEMKLDIESLSFEDKIFLIECINEDYMEDIIYNHFDKLDKSSIVKLATSTHLEDVSNTSDNISELRNDINRVAVYVYHDEIESTINSYLINFEEDANCMCLTCCTHRRDGDI